MESTDSDTRTKRGITRKSEDAAVERTMKEDMMMSAETGMARAITVGHLLTTWNTGSPQKKGMLNILEETGVIPLSALMEEGVNMTRTGGAVRRRTDGRTWTAQERSGIGNITTSTGTSSRRPAADTPGEHTR